MRPCANCTKDARLRKALISEGIAALYAVNNFFESAVGWTHLCLHLGKHPNWHHPVFFECPPETVKIEGCWRMKKCHPQSTDDGSRLRLSDGKPRTGSYQRGSASSQQQCDISHATAGMSHLHSCKAVQRTSSPAPFPARSSLERRVVPRSSVF